MQLRNSMRIGREVWSKNRPFGTEEKHWISLTLQSSHQPSGKSLTFGEKDQKISLSEEID